MDEANKLKRKEYQQHPDILCNVCGEFIEHGECNSSCEPELGLHAVHAIFCMCKSCANHQESQEINIDYEEDNHV